MGKLIISRKKFFGIAALFAALALGAVLPSGCSKESKSPEGQQQAAQGADAAKEHFDKGVQLSLKGQIDEAIKEYEETIRLNPKSSEAHNNLGFAYMDKGDVDKALEHQKHAVEINPNLANAYFGLAMAYEKKGDKPNAIANWKKFSEMSQPHSKWWTKAQEHIQALEGKKAATAAKKPEAAKK